MHAMLALEHTVGVGTLDHHGGRLDAGFVAVQHVQHLYIVAVRLRPAAVHTEQHLRPVLRLGAAGAGVEGQNGVVVVVLAVEHRHQLQLVDGFFDSVDRFLALGCQRGVVFLLDHQQQGFCFLVLGGQLAEALQLVLDLAHLADDLLAALLIVIKAGHRHLMLQLRQTLFAGFNGKGFAQIVHGGLHTAQFLFQVVNGYHNNTP